MQGIHLFTFKGIPVGVQPMFLLLVVILSLNMGGIAESIIFGICVFFGILIHEFGHALTARHYGLNPVVMLHGFGGVTVHARPATPKQDFLITLAGPGAGLVVGGIFWGIMKLTAIAGVSSAVLSIPYLWVFIQDMAWINLVWGVFNLIPCIPMDGSRLLHHILCKPFNPVKARKISVSISIVFVVLIFVWSLLNRNIFMIMISVLFLMSNIRAFREAFGESNPDKPCQKLSLEAEKAYERGLVAAREHDWKLLETCGYQMKKAANDEEQLKRAYEFLTIASTNQKNYAEGLEFSKRARQSEAVKQAVARCESQLEKE